MFCRWLQILYEPIWRSSIILTTSTGTVVLVVWYWYWYWYLRLKYWYLYWYLNDWVLATTLLHSQKAFVIIVYPIISTSAKQNNHFANSLTFLYFGRNSAVPVILYAYAKFEQCGITNRNQGFFVHILKEIALPMSDRSERPRRRRCKHWSIGFASRHHCASYLIHTLLQKNHTILFAL